MNMTWQFPADLSIIGWLEHKKYDYDVADRRGPATATASRRWRRIKCVITGTHPEYYSDRMLDATEDYIAGGGRYIYLGGNGYYWNVALRDDEPWILEVPQIRSWLEGGLGGAPRRTLHGDERTEERRCGRI